ncbi:hypothetical protein ACWKW4_21615, partial [Hydrogenophaga borbori]
MNQWRYGKEMSNAQRYAIALVIAVLAGALHWLLWPSVGALRPFVFYLPGGGRGAPPPGRGGGGGGRAAPGGGGAGAPPPRGRGAP